jgi:hypothetical protein
MVAGGFRIATRNGYNGLRRPTVSRRAAIILTIILATAIIAMFVVAGLLIRNARMPQDHLVPEGYTGWCTATYGVAGAPPLPVEGGHRILRYDANGVLETSSPFEEGIAVDNYYYVSGDERRHLRQRPPGMEGEIWHAYTSSQRVTRAGGQIVRTGVQTGFFVGTEEQYRADPGH